MRKLLLMLIFCFSALGCWQKFNMSGDSEGKDMAAVAIDNSEDENEEHPYLAEFMDLLEYGNNDDIVSLLEMHLKDDSKALIKLYPSIIAGDKQGFIHYAAAKGSLEVIQNFLELAKNKGVLKEVVNLSSESNVQPIHLAALRGDVEVVKCFIANGADPNAQDLGTNTVLHYAARKLANVEVVKYLLKEADNKASIEATIDKEDGSTVLHWAVENNNASMVRYLLDYCYSEHKLTFIDHKDDEGLTAESLAIKLNRRNIVRDYKSFKEKHKLV